MGNDKLSSFASRGALTYMTHGEGAELFQKNPELLEGAKAGIRPSVDKRAAETTAAPSLTTLPTTNLTGIPAESLRGVTLPNP